MIDWKKIKLTYIIDSLRLGGAERLTVTILGNLDPDLFDIRVCSLQRKNDNPIEKELHKIGIPVDQLHIKNLRSLSNLPKITAYLRSTRPDIVHTQLQFSDALGTLCARLLNIPVVSTQHLSGYPGDSKTLRRQRLTWWILRNFSNRIIVVSNTTKQFHTQAGKINVEKIETIYNGIQIDKFSEISETIRESTRDALKIPLESTVITTVAVHREPKGIQFMLEAMSTLIEIEENIKYLIVGDGPYRPELEKLTVDLGLSDHVIFTGQRSDIPEILSASDIFVLPTLADALPTVLFEAQAASLPILASEVGGIPEIITNGHDGLLVPPSDPEVLTAAIESLLNDEIWRDKLAKNGYETVNSNFSIDIQVKQLTKLYLDILGE